MDRIVSKVPSEILLPVEAPVMGLYELIDTEVGGKTLPGIATQIANGPVVEAAF
jgi:hypothetical protein